MSSRFNRRSFLGAAASAALTPYFFNSSASAQDKPNIQGFDQTNTDYDPTQEWRPFTDRKLRVGLVGYGVCQFSAQFEFQHHPNVEVVAVSDLFPDRCDALAKAVQCEKTYPSLEEMVKDDSIEAIFCATDAPSHAKHAVLCMEHGKHVCTAVPVFYGDIEDAERLLECCKKYPELKYAMFETSTFHDDLYAMEKIYQAGGFGRLIYSEGEYHHSHPCTPDTRKSSIGSYNNWRDNGAPLWYPTHASAYYVGVTHKSLTEVSAYGIKPFNDPDRQPNGCGNIFREELGVFKTAEGGVARIMVSNTMGPYMEAGRVRGEIGGMDSPFGYQGNEEGQKIVAALGNATKKPMLPPGVDAGGHGGSHGYLGNDFVEACLKDRPPRVGVIDALNMTVPGYYAHLSAMKDGENFKIPQYSL